MLCSKHLVFLIPFSVNRDWRMLSVINTYINRCVIKCNPVSFCLSICLSICLSVYLSVSQRAVTKINADCSGNGQSTCPAHAVCTASKCKCSSGFSPNTAMTECGKWNLTLNTHTDTETHTNRQIHRQTDRQTHTHTHTLWRARTRTRAHTHTLRAPTHWFIFLGKVCFVLYCKELQLQPINPLNVVYIYATF